MAKAHAENFDWKSVSGTGLYTVPMAARLLNEKQRILRSWIEGNAKSNAPPIIVRQLPKIGHSTVLGFLDLIEARFIKHFSDLGLSPQLIRKVSIRLRDKFGEDHPFATKNRFRTDGKKIFLEMVETEEEKRILDIMTDNFVMGPVIDQSLFETIFYAHDLAYRWRPLRDLPLIILDPKIAFGRPVIEKSWTPTHTLYNSYKAEGGDMEAVADEFRTSEEAVRQAIEFERSLEESTVH